MSFFVLKNQLKNNLKNYPLLLNIFKKIYNSGKQILVFFKKIKFKLNSLIHQTKYQKKIVEEYQKLSARSQSLGTHFIPDQKHEISLEQRKIVKNIALYLPQFHNIPENDLWWGKNFTEWINVVKTVPQYEGQFQPQLPVDLGFYDLLNKKTWEQQIEMAKNYGIYGFCFYFYWFNERRILEKPLDLFLKNTDLDLPFCLFWANDSWTRTWHGFSDQEQGSKTLLQQNHHLEDDQKVMEYLCSKVFNDKRYIKIGNKPIFIVYHTYLFKDLSATTTLWQKIAKEHGFEGIYLTHVQMPEQENVGLSSEGFQASMQFSPINCVREVAKVQIMNSNFSGQVYNYSAVVKTEKERKFVQKNMIRACFPSWDNEARRPTKGISYAKNTPELFQDYLKAMNQWAKENPIDDQESLVFVNAWNEWAEGAHLEPDREYGYAWLQAVANVVKEN